MSARKMAQILCLSLGAVLFYGSAIFLLVVSASKGNEVLPLAVALIGTCYAGLVVSISGYYRFAGEA